MYSSLYLQDTKPKFNFKYLAIFCAIIISILGLYVATKNVAPFTRASQIKSSNVQVIGLKDQSVNIFVESTQKTHAQVLYGTSKNNLTLSSKDVRGDVFLDNFMFSIFGLDANKTYYYQIVFEDGVAQSPTGETVMSFTTTASNFDDLPVTTPIYGKIANESGTAIAGAIVIVKAQQEDTPNNSNIAYAITNDEGAFLANIDWATSTKSNIVLQVYGPNSKSKILTNILKASPLPQIITIGQDFDFTTANQVLGATQKATAPAALEPQSLGLFAADYVLQVTYPLQNAQIAAKSPLIKGKGIPGTQVKATINSTPATIAQTKVGKDGSWVVEPGKNFLPGTYLLQVSLNDSSGREQVIARTFTIAKSGEQVLAATTSNISTPSATLAPTSKPNTTPIATPARLPTALITQPQVPLATPPVYTPPQKLPQAGLADLNILVYIGAIAIGLGLLLINTNKV